MGRNRAGGLLGWSGEGERRREVLGCSTMVKAEAARKREKRRRGGEEQESVPET